MNRYCQVSMRDMKITAQKIKDYVDVATSVICYPNQNMRKKSHLLCEIQYRGDNHDLI